MDRIDWYRIDPDYREAIRSRLPDMTGAVLHWFQNALRRPDRKWTAVALLELNRDAAGYLVRDLLEAAVYELNPSYNRSFVELLTNHITAPQAVEALLSIGDAGGDLAYGGVARAAYWVWIDLPSPKREAAVRLNSWMLSKFIESNAVVAQRCLIAGIRFEESKLTEEARKLRAEAIRKARSHTDEYIRHRLQINLGESSEPLMCLDTSEAPERPKRDPLY